MRFREAGGDGVEDGLEVIVRFDRVFLRLRVNELFALFTLLCGVARIQPIEELGLEATRLDGDRLNPVFPELYSRCVLDVQR